MAKTVKKTPPTSSGPKASAKASSPKAAAPKQAAKAAPPTASKAAAPKGSTAKKSAPKKAAVAPGNDGGGLEPMLDKLFYDSLKDIYYAEKLLIKTLPRLRKAATTEELRTCFEEHTNVTKGQVGRLEQVFQILGKRNQAKKCEAMDGLVKEAESIVEDTEAGTMTRDVGLIMAAQKVEHYEIATYGSLAQLAKLLGQEDIKNLLGQTLDEEKQTDLLLTQIAESKVNAAAESEDEGEESSASEESNEEE